ncbi:cytochrome b [Motilimonas pumila]|uniref:Cytochrome b n=1 Tax=Motilimonas pumila TaxID=2303987 RepID=A0A418YIU2_9GAMM|nr:cytochrome b [Motilimonas pumila]RJG50539.1 cytochrome b [Motilimonas pumila]
MLRNTSQGYGLVAITIHWLVAVVVVGLFAVGLWMIDLSYYSSWYQTAPMWHKSVGLTLFLVMMFRLVWRLMSVQPASPSQHHALEKLGAKLGHGAIYVLLFVIMVSGYLISTADGRPILMFSMIEIPALVTDIPQQEDIAGLVHEYAAWALIIIASGHGLAALKHHFVDKDNTLKRMLKPVK